MDKKEFTKQLGKRIKECRHKANITQTELALRCGKDRQHIELIENGKTTCTSYTLYLIVKSLKCSYDELFSFEQD
ncbi:MAG: transcriptional regulator [Flavobacteriales bacterium]|nr:transcriptional regulator [Flavobacteriales bacterium]